MAESRLQAPDLGAQLGVSSCLKKCQKSSPNARRQPFSGKSFYLDLPAGKNLQYLTGAIQQLGGVIEGFLSKEVSYIVSSRREAKAESSGTSHRGCHSPSKVRVETPSTADPKGNHTRPSQKPAALVLMSRGKELLQKAIGNQGSSGGGSRSSSLLTSASSWGVRVLHVDEMMVHVQQLSLDALCVRKQGPKKPEGTCPAESRTRKVARLKAPFLKIEDESRKFRPFHHQFKSFPEINFLGPKDASPFEAPTTPGSSHHTREPKNREPSPGSAACATPGRRKGYCECCQEAFGELCGHLHSARHQGFALEGHLYAEVDRIIAQLSHSLANIPSQANLPGQPGSPVSDCNPRCPETPPSSQPSHRRAASPRMREEDDHRAPGTPGLHGMAGDVKASAEPVGAGKTPGPETSCQEVGGSVDVIVDPLGTPVSRSPHQCLLTSSGFADPASGADLALAGHKRKIQFPSSSAEKRPGVSWPEAAFFVPRALSSCGTRTTSDRHCLSFPLPSHASRPQALCHPQTCVSLPDPCPWQPKDRPAEFWATWPPWPGGRWPPGCEDSEYAVPGPVSGWLTSSPAAPLLQASCQPTCTQLWACSPQKALPRASPPLPDPLSASGGASCSQWLWAPQPLPVPCLPAPAPAPAPAQHQLRTAPVSPPGIHSSSDLKGQIQAQVTPLQGAAYPARGDQLQEQQHPRPPQRSQKKSQTWRLESN